MSYWIRFVSVLAVAALCFGIPALSSLAQEAETTVVPQPTGAPPAETPEAFAQRFAEVTRSGDWEAFADLMHPEALATFKGLFSEIVDLVDSEEMLESMFGVTSAEDFEELSGGRVFIEVMNSLEKLVPGFAEALAESSMDVVGSVTDDDGVVHVVYKMQLTVEDIGLSRTSVVSLRRDGDGWGALLTGNVEGMARSLAQVMVASPEVPPALQDDEDDGAAADDSAEAEAS